MRNIHSSTQLLSQKRNAKKFNQSVAFCRHSWHLTNATDTYPNDVNQNHITSLDSLAPQLVSNNDSKSTLGNTKSISISPECSRTKICTNNRENHKILRKKSKFKPPLIQFSYKHSSACYGTQSFGNLKKIYCWLNINST